MSLIVHFSASQKALIALIAVGAIAAIGLAAPTVFTLLAAR